MTPTDAEADMFEGYLDGMNPDAPEPNRNRSQSYRHGFRNGRADRAGRSNGPAMILRQAHDAAVSADLRQ